jgi:MFS family permease
MIPMLAGFAVMGPISGWLSDRYGARGFSTFGMVIVGATFYALAILPYNFSYLSFAAILFIMGIGSGMFASPNTASIMNSVPEEHRGAASGMRSTLQNTGSVASLALFFSIVISALAGSLPAAFASAFKSAGVPQLGSVFAQIPPTGALFAAFLGYNPVGSIIAQLQNSPQTAQLVASVPQQTMTYITGNSFFPNAIAPAFMSALAFVFFIGLGLSLAAAVSSLLRGKVYIYEKEAASAAMPRIPLPITTPVKNGPDPGSQATDVAQSNPVGGSPGAVPRREKEES